MREDILQALSELIKEKTELKAEKIELALVDDLKDLIKKGLSIEKKLAGQITSYNGLLRAGGEFKKKYSNLEKIAKEMKSIKSEFDKAGKELGVDYKGIKEYKDLVFHLDTAITFSKQAKEVSKKIRKYLK